MVELNGSTEDKSGDIFHILFQRPTSLLHLIPFLGWMFWMSRK